MSETAAYSRTSLSVRELTIGYGRSRVVDSFSMRVDGGNAVLFGPSGCGKTSILKAILNTREPGMHWSGTILLDGEPVSRGAGDVGMVFQGPVLPEWLTLEGLCRMGSRIRRVPREEQVEETVALLQRFGIEQLANRFPSSYSGGQKQRAALAVALLNKPRLLLLDEPSTFLDGISRLAIWEFLETELRTFGVPTVVVTHDPEEAAILGDTVYRLDALGRLVDQIDVPMSHPRKAEALRERSLWAVRADLRGTSEHDRRRPAE